MPSQKRKAIEIGSDDSDDAFDVDAPAPSVSSPSKVLRRGRDEQIIGDLEHKLQKAHQQNRRLQDSMNPLLKQRDELKTKVDNAEPERQRLRANLDEAEATLGKLAAAVRRVLPDWELEKDTAIELDGEGETDGAVAGEDCVICRDSWTDDWSAAAIYPCGHCFHQECSQQYLKSEQERARAALYDAANMFDDAPIDASLGRKVKCPLCRKVTMGDQIIVGVDTIQDGWTTVTELLTTWASRQRPETEVEEAEDPNAVTEEDPDDGVREASLESDVTEDGAEGAQIVGATGGVAETSSEEEESDDEPVEVDPPAPTSTRPSSGKASARRVILDSDDDVEEAPVASTSSQARTGKLTPAMRAELLAKKQKRRF